MTSGEVLSTLTGFTGDLNIREKARAHLSVLMPSADNFESFPETLKHGAVNFKGKIYEFNTNEGIITSPNADKYKREYAAEVCSGFSTDKSLEQFEEWVETQRDQFGKENYDMVQNNCTHFVANVCKYLEIDFPDIFVKQQAFLDEHQREITHLAPVFFESRQRKLSNMA